ncbi:MAG: ferritin-like domain-containing protein [Rhodocyclaceae bacterium]
MTWFDPTAEVRGRALVALMISDPAAKCAAVDALVDAWHAGHLALANTFQCPPIVVPGRPVRPELVAATSVPRRNAHTAEGHAALVHAIAHIEFNAINLALDCVARFGCAGASFVSDWLRVAHEEAGHYRMLSARLGELGYRYGDFTAHNGLWDMAVQTASDFLARMALVPRLLEARGLDATPPIQAKLRTIGDQPTLAILDVILHDEMGHVSIGDRWYRQACAAAGRDPEAYFLTLIERFRASPPRPPMNRDARLAAGFSAAELDGFEALAAQAAAH